MVLLCGRDVPLEIVDAIIDYHLDDRKTLQACSLVCRTFTLCSQRRLFRQVYIDSRRARVPDAEEANASYYNGLKDISRHLEHVESLFIWITRGRFGTSILIDTLGRMVNLKKVHIDCFSHSPEDKKLLPYCCTPTIKHIYIANASQVALPFLNRCVSLEQLSFDWTQPLIAVDDRSSELPDFEVPASSSQVILKSLFISAMHCDRISDWLEDPRCPVSIRELVALGIEEDRLWDSSRYVARLIPKYFQMLEVLALQPSLDNLRNFSEVDGSAIVLDLALLPRLTCLVFSFYESTIYRATCLSWAIAQLSTLSTEKKLKELQIWIKTDATDGCENLNEWGQCWERLDGALSDRRFDGLQDVYVDFSKTRDLGGFIGRFHEFMPSTREQKSLYVVESLPDQALNRDRSSICGILNENFQERLSLVRAVCKGSRRL